MNERTEVPVFYDHTGRRWKRVQLILAIVTLFTAIALSFVIPSLLRATAVNRFGGAAVAAVEPETIPPTLSNHMFSYLKPFDPDAAKRPTYSNYALLTTKESTVASRS